MCRETQAFDQMGSACSQAFYFVLEAQLVLPTMALVLPYETAAFVALRLAIHHRRAANRLLEQAVVSWPSYWVTDDHTPLYVI